MVSPLVGVCVSEVRRPQSKPAGGPSGRASAPPVVDRALSAPEYGFRTCWCFERVSLPRAGAGWSGRGWSGRGRESGRSGAGPGRERGPGRGKGAAWGGRGSTGAGQRWAQALTPTAVEAMAGGAAPLLKLPSRLLGKKRRGRGHDRREQGSKQHGGLRS